MLDLDLGFKVVGPIFGCGYYYTDPFPPFIQSTTLEVQECKYRV